MTFRGRRDLHIIPPTVHMAVSITVQTATITRQQYCLNSSMVYTLCLNLYLHFTLPVVASIIVVIIQLNDASKLAAETGRWTIISLTGIEECNF